MSGLNVLRRTVLRLLLLGGMLAPLNRAALARIGPAHAADFSGLAEAVLPAEIGADGRARALERFLDWLRGYQPGAEMDHGYGITRLWRAPPSPAARYVLQFDDLNRRTGVPFSQAGLDARRRAVTEAIDAAGLRELPERPDGRHVATDLMAHFFNSPEANDLAYRRTIGRFGCRGLGGSGQLPPAFPGAEPAA
jgi:hypothetical protein